MKTRMNGAPASGYKTTHRFAVRPNDVAPGPWRRRKSHRDAKGIVDELTAKNVKLNIGGSVHNSNGPVGRLLFNVIAMVAEFGSGLIRALSRGGMQIARAKGHLSAVASPSSALRSNDISFRCIEPARTRLRNSPKCLGSDELSCTAGSTATLILAADRAAVESGSTWLRWAVFGEDGGSLHLAGGTREMVLSVQSDLQDWGLLQVQPLAWSVSRQ